MHSHLVLMHVFLCHPGSSPFIPHLGHNLKIYATMWCYIIQLYLRRISQGKVIVSKKQLERNRTAFVLAGPVHFLFQTEICFYDMFQHIPTVSFDRTGTIQHCISHGICMKITWFFWSCFVLFTYLLFYYKNQRRKYEKNSMLLAEAGKNIWGSHILFSVRAQKQVNVKINSCTLKKHWNNPFGICSGESLLLLPICSILPFREVSKNLPVLLFEVTYCINYKRTQPNKQKAFSMGCESKFLHLLEWNSKSNLSMIYQPFVSDLAEESLPHKVRKRGKFCPISCYGTTQCSTLIPADQKSASGT